MDDRPDTYIDQTLAFGPFTLYRSRKLLLDGDRGVKLGGRAFDVLIALVERAGEVVSKQQLVECVWPNVLVEESSLRVHVAALRKALGDGQNGIRYIANVPGRGYCFIGQIMRLPGPRTLAVDGPRNHNLPGRLTRLVGREESLRAVAQGLPMRRFVTIVGPGGMGKTTIALAAAEQLAAGYRDGVRFVDLSMLSDVSSVHAAIANALAISLGMTDPTEAIVECLHEKQLLLLLDSCERAVDAAASTVTAILQGAPGVHLLATSREPLLAPGELVHRVQGLATPPTYDRIAAAEALKYSAVQLFVERAIASVDTFELGDADASLVSRLCGRLDGMPLAIELAAAQIDSFGLLGLARQLEDHFAMLSTEQRTGLVRHRTLRAMLDWSYDTLLPSEQEVLKRLAVFRGSFTLEDAVAVANDASLTSMKIVAALGELCVKSLLIADATEHGVRYRLLDITRAYAFEMLHSEQECREMRRRHANYLRDLIDRAGREQDNMSARAWCAAYGSTMDDVRAALEWAFSAEGDLLLGIQLTTVAMPLGYQLSLVDEMRGHVARALSEMRRLPEPDPALQVRLMTGLNHLSSAHQGASPLQEAQEQLEFSERALIDTQPMQVINAQWVDVFGRGDYPRSLQYADRLTRLARASPDPKGMLVADRLRAQSLHFMGQHEESARLAERVLNHPTRALRLSISVGTPLDRRVSMRIILARILWLRALPAQAQVVTAEALRYAEDDVSYSLSQVLVFAALPIAILCGDWPRASAFLSQLSSHAKRTSHRHYAAWAANYEKVLGQSAMRDSESSLVLHPESDNWQKDMFAALSMSLLTPEALARAENGAAPWCAPAVLRSRGESILARARSRDDVSCAAALFERAAALSSLQGTLTWELRALTSLVRLQARVGTPGNALRRLSAAYDRCTEGFETADLCAARAELEMASA